MAARPSIEPETQLWNLFLNSDSESEKNWRFSDGLGQSIALKKGKSKNLIRFWWLNINENTAEQFLKTDEIYQIRSNVGPLTTPEMGDFIIIFDQANTKEIVGLGEFTDIGSVHFEFQFIESYQYNRINEEALDSLDTTVISEPFWKSSDELLLMTIDIYKTLLNFIRRNAEGDTEHQLHNTKLQLHNDIWSPVDLLGYKLYAKAITQIILDKDSKPPLTIAVIAPWGNGKTTLMKYIQERIKNLPASKQTKEVKEGDLKKISNPTIWFNPWIYQSSNQVWAGMAHCLILQLAEHLKPVEREKFWLQLNAKRINIHAVRQEIFKSVITKVLPSLIIFIIAFVVLLVMIFKNIASSGYLSIPAIFSISSAVHAVWAYRKNFSEGLKTKQASFFKPPDYQSNFGFLHEVREDLKKAFDLLVEDRVVIFIDDLDRLAPQKTVEVIEALNSLVNARFSDKCYFVIGMDAQMVAASLDTCYQKMYGKLAEQEKMYGSIGWYFLDKFVQLPFFIPTLRSGQKEDFLSQLFEKEEPAKEEKTVESEVEIEIQAAAKKLMEEESPSKIEAIRQTFQAPKENLLLDEKIIEITIEENKDSDEIRALIREYCRFIGTSPRNLKRFANLLRFHSGLQNLRKTKREQYASTSSLAKWLTITIRWPQLVRWIQWSIEETIFIKHIEDSEKEITEKEKIVVSHPREKAEALDKMIANVLHLNKRNSDEDQFDKFYQTYWLPVIEANKELKWLNDQELFRLLISKSSEESTLEKALLCAVW